MIADPLPVASLMSVICFEENFMKAIASILCVVCALVALSACNTVQGLGKDIERGGQAIERVAK